MKESEVQARAFAMPLTSPAYPIGPYRFVNREFLIIALPDRSAEIARACATSPCRSTSRLVKFEIHSHAGFDRLRRLHESGQVIPVSCRAAKAATRTACFSTTIRRSPAARELWGFPKKLAQADAA